MNTSCVALGRTWPSLSLVPLIYKIRTAKSTRPITSHFMDMILFNRHNINVG